MPATTNLTPGPITLTIDQMDDLADAVADAGAKLRERYAGRGMFGAECVGAVGRPDPSIAIIGAAHAIDPDLARLLTYAQHRTDSMGRDTIIYWPELRAPQGWLP